MMQYNNLITIVLYFIKLYSYKKKIFFIYLCVFVSCILNHKKHLSWKRIYPIVLLFLVSLPT